MRARPLAMGVYGRCVRLVTGSGLNDVGLVRRFHNALLRRLRPESVDLFGHRLYLDPFDSLNLSVHGQVEPEETAIARKFVLPGSTVVDVGAHIGYFTLLFATLAGSAGRVYAFEPHPGNAGLLRRTVADAGFKHVTIEQKAVGQRAGSVTLRVAPDSSVDHRTVAVPEPRNTIEVETISLDEYFDEGARVDFIKMDIQGAEGFALRGMERLIRRNARLTLLVEYEPWGLEASGFGATNFVEALADHGFTLYDVHGPGGTTTADTPSSVTKRYPIVKDRHTNLLCVKGDTS